MFEVGDERIHLWWMEIWRLNSCCREKNQISQSFKSTAKCKPVVDELRSADSLVVSQIYVGHLGSTAFLTVEITVFAVSTVIFLGIIQHSLFVPKKIYGMSNLRAKNLCWIHAQI